MIDIDEHPEYVCSNCGWMGDEEEVDYVITLHRWKPICPKCTARCTIYGEYHENESANARDDELENRRLKL